MPIPLDTLEAEVLKLPADARSHLLDRLIASLGTDAEIEEAWALESERRDAEVDERDKSAVYRYAPRASRQAAFVRQAQTAAPAE